MRLQDYHFRNHYHFRSNQNLRSLPRPLARILAARARNAREAERAPLRVILEYTATGETDVQYYAVMFYYKLLSSHLNCQDLHPPKLRRYKRLTGVEKERIIEMWRQGASVYAIAKALGRHSSTIWYLLKREGLLTPHAKRRG